VADPTPAKHPQTRLDPNAAATERWMRRQRLLSPFRAVWHRLLSHEVGRYACFTCDMDLPR
jgi:hypothetical protein